MVDATNVATLLDAFADRGAKADMASRNMADLMAKQAEIETRSAEELRGIGEDAALVTKTAGEGMLAAQTATSQAIKLLEGNTLDPMSLKAQSMVEFVSRKREADGQLEEIKQKSAIGFFDNPLEYIMNQMDLPKLQTQYNLTAAQANSALRTVNDIDTTLTTEATANKATAITQTTASIAAASRIAAESYRLQASDAEYKALGLNITANQVINQGNATQVDMLYKSYEVLNNEEMRKRQMLEYDIQKKRFDQWEIEHKDTMEGKAYVRNIIRTGMGVLGMRNPDDNTMAQYEQAYKTPEGRKEIQHIIDAGQRKLFSGVSAIGSDPANAFYTVASVGDYSKNKEYAPAMAAIGNVASFIAAPNNPQRVDPRKVTEFSSALNAGVAKAQKTWDADPENSPVYKAPTMERMADIEVVRNTPWFKEIVAPSILAAKATGAVTPPIPAAKLYEQTLAAVDAGTLTIDQAADGIATYYAMAGKVNAIKNGVVGIGPQNGYNVKISGSPAFGSTINMADPTQVTHAIVTNIKLGVYDMLDSAGLRSYRTFDKGAPRPTDNRPESTFPGFDPTKPRTE